MRVRMRALASLLLASASSSVQQPTVRGSSSEWPATAVLSLQLAPNERLSSAIDSYRFIGGVDAPVRPPNERLPRRGLSGLPVVLSPVMVDVAASLAGVDLGAAADTPWLLELCFAVTPYLEFESVPSTVDEKDLDHEVEIKMADNTTNGSVLGLPPQCAPLLGYRGVPPLHDLRPGTTATFSAWLQHPALPGARSATAQHSFEVASHVRHLRDVPHTPSASTATAKEGIVGGMYEAPLPYDGELVARVSQCVASKTEEWLLGQQRQEDDAKQPPQSPSQPQPLPEVEGIYRAWESDGHESSAFLGAALRRVLNAQQLAQLEFLVDCARAEPRHPSLGSAYDGAVRRDDFGSDPRYEPHTLVNLNPYLNAGVLENVKQRIYEAVDTAVTAGGGHTSVFLNSNDEEDESGRRMHAGKVKEEAEGTGGLSAAEQLRPQRKRQFALGFRCVEHISYPPGVGLEEHEDEDSTYTVSVLLSDASEYEGGNFVLLGDTRVAEAFAPGDALVFASMRAHKVTPVTAGRRRVLVVELWPFPDGAVPTRVAVPQKYPPPVEDAAAAAPPSWQPTLSPPSPFSTTAPLQPAAATAGEATTHEKATENSGDLEARTGTDDSIPADENDSGPLGVFGDQYVVLRGGLVGTGHLPFRGNLSRQRYWSNEHANASPESSIDATVSEDNASADAAVEAAQQSIAAGWFTWPEAIAACDLLLTCTAFTFQHPTPLLGDDAQRQVRVHVAFKREASPIRVKGLVGSGGDGTTDTAGYGGDGCAASAWGSACWTAIKPWPMHALLNEFAHFEPPAASPVDTATKDHDAFESGGGSRGVELTADYRECEEWALDGHCARLPAFMNRNCGFFCRKVS